MADAKFFIKPFAVEGDMDAVPDDMQASGEVSYATGYGFDYERDPATDANAKDIERTKLNAVLHDVTACLRQYQTQGVFPYITAAQNKGNPYSYSKRARCLYAAPGKDLDVYESLVDSNTALPTDVTKWIKVSGVDMSGFVVDTDDRLSDTRTPKVHAASHKTGGADSITPVDIGAYAAANMATAATASKGVLRDANGRAQIVTPSVAADIANKGYCDALPGTRVWTSGEYTPVAGAVTTVTHGISDLNATEAHAEVWLVCRTADAGWAVGDVVRDPMTYATSGAAYFYRQSLGLLLTSTTISIRNGAGLALPPKGGSTAGVGITLASWRIFFTIRY